MFRHSVFAALAATVLFAAGCAENKAPASKAIDNVEKSLAEIRDDAKRYAPDGLKGVESNLERMKASLEAKDYENVLAGTPSLEKAVASLKSAVANGKAHAAKAAAVAKSEWNELNEEVPAMVKSIEARVDELGKKKRLPFGVSKDEFEGAKTSFDGLKSLWADATSDFNAGHSVKATEKAKTAKGMALEIRDRLNIKDEPKEVTAATR
jgi:hypothetical protein